MSAWFKNLGLRTIQKSCYRGTNATGHRRRTQSSVSSYVVSSKGRSRRGTNRWREYLMCKRSPTSSNPFKAWKINTKCWSLKAENRSYPTLHKVTPVVLCTNVMHGEYSTDLGDSRFQSLLCHGNLLGDLGQLYTLSLAYLTELLLR